MKRIVIICEGETEQEFCKQLLIPKFAKSNIHVIATLIEKSLGGMVNWESLKKQISKTLKNDKACFVTTFIDFYGIKERHRFPDWMEALALKDKYQKKRIIEDGMRHDIDSSLNYRFLPYLQLHEFEALMFINKDILLQNFESNEIRNIEELDNIMDEFDNPELINDDQKTAPSKRLKNIFLSYNKVIHGTLIAEELGLSNIREKCPGFNDWIFSLENISAN